MQSYIPQKWVKPAIIVGAILLVILMIVPIFSSRYNRTVTLEENVHISQSNISKEEQRRVDLFNNLVDAVQSAKTFEQETQTKIAEARSQANKGQVEQAAITLASVVEAYPEIKSTALYQQTMTEFSVTENRLAGYREQYNIDVRSYYTYVRKFGNGLILGIMGYDKKDFKYLDYKVDNREARDLFN